MFDGFRLETVAVAPEVRLRVRHARTGPAVVLLHGHPRTHTTWHRVAPQLLEAGFRVVCPDLRGYGGSTAPVPEPDHAQASKRAMAADVVALMAALGEARSAIAGHDRGSYVAFRLAMDHPDAVSRLAVLDSVPIGEALARADARFAPEPRRPPAGDPRPGRGRAMLEDYRAGVGVDRAHDEADRSTGRRLRCPTLVAWSTRDDMELLYGDPTAIWRSWAPDVRGSPSRVATTGSRRTRTPSRGR